MWRQCTCDHLNFMKYNESLIFEHCFYYYWWSLFIFKTQSRQSIWSHGTTELITTPNPYHVIQLFIILRYIPSFVVVYMYELPSLISYWPKWTVSKCRYDVLRASLPSIGMYYVRKTCFLNSGEWRYRWLMNQSHLRATIGISLKKGDVVAFRKVTIDYT